MTYMIIFTNSHAVYSRFAKIRKSMWVWLENSGQKLVDVWCRQEDMQQRGPMPDVATPGAAAFGKEWISWWWWWWFQISLIFTPIWGRFPNWLIFSGGLKPPTRFSCIPKESIEHLFSCLTSMYCTSAVHLGWWLRVGLFPKNLPTSKKFGPNMSPM